MLPVQLTHSALNTIGVSVVDQERKGGLLVCERDSATLTAVSRQG